MLLNWSAGEDSWESLRLQEIKPINPKGNWSWIFNGKTDVEAETPIHLPPDVKSWLIWKDPDAGKDWRREEKGTTDHEMVGWLLQLSGHEFEQASELGDGQGRLACCSPWGCKESDTTEWLNWTELAAFQPWLHFRSIWEALKQRLSRTSQVVQWIRVPLPMQGTWVQSLVWEDSTSCGTTKPCTQLLNSECSRVHVLQQKTPLQWEAHAPQRTVASTHCN